MAVSDGPITQVWDNIYLVDVVVRATDGQRVSWHCATLLREM
jgi:hypothetical protein